MDNKIIPPAPDVQKLEYDIASIIVAMKMLNEIDLDNLKRSESYIKEVGPIIESKVFSGEKGRCLMDIFSVQSSMAVLAAQINSLWQQPHWRVFDDFIQF